jgi:glycosyltransferase involved in cell wall biosynthesis
MKNFSDHFKISCKLDYIYNPIDKGSNNKYDLNSKKIVSIGHIRKIKNFLVIPDVARCVFDKHPDWTWEIYGSYRTERNEELNYYNELKAKIEEYGLKDKVILCGRTDDTSSVYDSAAIYVMTSLQEGLPMVLLEAKAHNLPIVSFDIETGPEEIVDDCVNGYLIEPYDVERMAERICDLIKDEKLRGYFSKNTILGQERFLPDGIIEKWSMLLEG